MNTKGARAGVFAVIFALVGCGAGSDERNQVKGTVSFNSKPVVMGMIYFDPDISKKNTGVQGIAEIKDGKFDTRSEGKGGPLGAVVIRVEAFDGKADGERPKGGSLFVTESRMELAKDAVLALDLKTSDVKKPGSTGVHEGP